MDEKDKQIAALEAENRRLRKALSDIPMVNHIYGDADSRAEEIEAIVRAALDSAA